MHGREIKNSLVVAAVAIALFLLVSWRFMPDTASSDWRWPLLQSELRPKVLHFGLYVTPESAENPIMPPERFQGYHTGLDLELLPGEEEQPVPVYASCAGTVQYADKDVPGYGGVVVTSCRYQKAPVTVLYGHIDPDTFQVQQGRQVQAGDWLATLSQARTAASGFNRKHLHFAIHRGSEIELLGYVDDETELAAYIDPLLVLP